MEVAGIICEYNPFHNGHARQLAAVGAGRGVVCLMSGSYVQRGEPAILDRYVRAEAAVRCGADLVLELPITYALRSAEGFADGGVELLERLGGIDVISFGSESGDAGRLWGTARSLLSPAFPQTLKQELDRGLSFPAARVRALAQLGEDPSLLEQPNDILGVEYCKALLRRDSGIRPLVLHRDGDYHGGSAREQPSASFLRRHPAWSGYVPAAALECYQTAARHTVAAGERAWLARLRAMEEAEFAQLPYGTEGLWRRVMAACRTECSLAEIAAAAKSRRYTHTRLMRMLLCGFLGITAQMLTQEAPYVRVLALNETGGRLLRQFRRQGALVLLNGEERAPECPYAALERRAGALYGLFCTQEPEQPARRRGPVYVRCSGEAACLEAGTDTAKRTEMILEDM